MYPCIRVSWNTYKHRGSMIEHVFLYPCIIKHIHTQREQNRTCILISVYHRTNTNTEGAGYNLYRCILEPNFGIICYSVFWDLFNLCCVSSIPWKPDGYKIQKIFYVFSSFLLRYLTGWNKINDLLFSSLLLRYLTGWNKINDLLFSSLLLQYLTGWNKIKGLR